VDGQPLTGLDQYRFAPPEFGADLPDQNIWQAFGGCPTPAGHYQPLVPDGIYVMLAPLSVGPHTIHFRGTIGDPVNFTPEATYDLKVRNGADWITAGHPASALEGTAPQDVQATPSPATSWGKLKMIYR